MGPLSAPESRLLLLHDCERVGGRCLRFCAGRETTASGQPPLIRAWLDGFGRQVPEIEPRLAVTARAASGSASRSDGRPRDQDALDLPAGEYDKMVGLDRP